MNGPSVPSESSPARFRRAYTALREREGRGSGGIAELLSLPYLRDGPWKEHWRVRARTFECFVDTVVEPLSRAKGSGLRVLDLGAGNGWLCYRLHALGHEPVAVDWRYDRVDGLGAAGQYHSHGSPMFPRLAASFDALPLPPSQYDLAVFNASAHYSTDLHLTLTEAVRVLIAGGTVAILDSPFYRSARDGEAMVAEKRAGQGLDLGTARDDLLSISSIEYLTRDRLFHASQGLGLRWRRHRVRYPFTYELRPLKALLLRRRAPSRFDLWEGSLDSDRVV
jgi:SAM-dependent methyltransferase